MFVVGVNVNEYTKDLDIVSNASCLLFWHSGCLPLLLWRSFYGAYEESAEHLLVSCGMTQTIWDFINTWYMLYGFFFFEFEDQLKIYKQARGSVKWGKVAYSIILHLAKSKQYYLQP
ncbi:hypothetical protein Hdeb2414_s0006g00215401 [Helianthus debilis subsp. tardiflorus]